MISINDNVQCWSFVDLPCCKVVSRGFWGGCGMRSYGWVEQHEHRGCLKAKLWYELMR